jgi:hypothetical protein
LEAFVFLRFIEQEIIRPFLFQFQKGLIQ